jgi:hypothetical protein
MWPSLLTLVRPQLASSAGYGLPQRGMDRELIKDLTIPLFTGAIVASTEGKLK